MQTSNRGAMEAARRAGVRAATDISGFGFAGHLGEMAQASGVDIEVEVDALPALPGALELLECGERSTSHHQNTRLPLPVRRQASPGPRLELAFDPRPRAVWCWRSNRSGAGAWSTTCAPRDSLRRAWSHGP